MKTTEPPRMRYLAACAALFAVLVWVALSAPDLDSAVVKDAARHFGPVTIVLLVALGIVVSPIPSGVVAMVAGALYGTYMGGALTIAGAVLGAASAFLLSRHLGRERLAALQFNMTQALTRDRSQTALMATVFATRLIPFISFDAVSYLAGLTPLAFWRFTLATAAGTTPVCLAFAAAGDTASQGGMHPAAMAGLAGVTLLVPAVLFTGRALRRRPSMTA